ncbi:MAG: 50S ribosomal protein L24 [Desulfobulbus sp.]|jgi:large subunit ribosomal protein L24
MGQGRVQLKVNDKVEVIAGKDKGRVGKVLKIEKAARRVVVERINMIKQHQKSRDPNQPGQIIEREASIDISNVMLVCPECAETVRVGSKTLEDGSKARTCKKCQATIETPKK